jgi:hypothetical protein
MSEIRDARGVDGAMWFGGEARGWGCMVYLLYLLYLLYGGGGPLGDAMMG